MSVNTLTIGNNGNFSSNHSSSYPVKVSYQCNHYSLGFHSVYFHRHIAYTDRQKKSDLCNDDQREITPKIKQSYGSCV